jgi:hypothetical protein
LTVTNEAKRNEDTVEPLVRHFRLHWLSGKPQDISTWHDGSRMEAAAAAMNEAGIGAGALGALDYWEELPNDKHESSAG